MDATTWFEAAHTQNEDAQLPVVVMGRPTTYNEAIAHKICDLIASGVPIRTVCETKGLPAKATVMDWLKQHEDFRRAYAVAKDCAIEDIFDETLAIADADYTVPVTVGGDGNATIVKMVDKGALLQARLKIDTRFKIAAKIAPRKYSGRIVEEAAPPAPSNGDDAKVIDGHAIPLDQHPLYDQLMAWERAGSKK